SLALERRRRGWRDGCHARVRRGDELLPRLPGLSDRMPRRRGLRGAVRDGTQRHRVEQCAARTGTAILARTDAGVSLHASACAATARTSDAHLSTQRAGVVGPTIGCAAT